MNKDVLKKLEDHLKARSKIMAEIAHQNSELSKKLDEHDDSGSSDGIGSASMSMKMLELQFTAAVEYFKDLEDPDKEATEILNQLATVVDLLEAANVVDAFPFMRKAVDQAIEYKLKHTGEEFALDPKKMMGLIKEFVPNSDNGEEQRTVKDALAELEKMHPKKSTDLKL